MSQRNTLILLAVFAALLAVLFFTRREGAGGAATATPAAPVTVWEGLASTDITRIEMTDHTAGQRLVLKKENETWQVVTPENRPADENQAASAASQLAGLRVTRALTETADLKPFGVLSPHYTLALEKTGGQVLALDIGDRLPVGSGYYALRQGETALLIVNSFTVDSLAELIGAPPYYLTPTPSPEPGATPTPTPEGAATPPSGTPGAP